ncbi:MgtC/SapB family protein [Butyricicoccus sp. Marseille-Q5471]|uniref:MgtC/SapB family protein n=1 Tax=Butyricicoccus sp. Marseille-Q5471 TaxID=3039493 RepID=UPI0024BC7B86|nr:MgtC/SapB family protein [Butyricicoccus sp. Marseille-Q5471]
MGQITLVDITLRLLAAMAVGFFVGGQRARTAHPAGLRTHMLVALGACVVMITGSLLYYDTNTMFGTGPDPARLGAQVISGVGFLGAGTIMKEGFSVRGLTTAASLWSVACLGLAAGMGYYWLTLLGGIAIFLTLIAFDSIQHAVRYGKRPELDIQLECEHMSEVLVAVDELADRHFASLVDLSFGRTSHNTYIISFRANFPAKNYEFAQSQFTQSLAAVPGIVSMENRNDNA